MKTKTFTPAQMECFRRYVIVQKSNRYNMLTPAAVRATGMSKEEHFFVIENYDALAAAAKAVAA